MDARTSNALKVEVYSGAWRGGDVGMVQGMRTGTIAALGTFVQLADY